MAKIDIGSIQYILKSRGWNLPIVSLEQTENLISKLKNSSAADFYGLTSKHIKKGGPTSIVKRNGDLLAVSPNTKTFET